jgi:hypothetical protein
MGAHSCTLECNRHGCNQTPLRSDKWNAVYGAMIALQVRDHNREGKSMDNATMQRFVEEAEAVADWSEDC